jgi:hypothetical protein
VAAPPVCILIRPPALANSISHEGIVQSIGDGEAMIAVATGGCSAWGKRSACGIGKLAAGARTALVTIPLSDAPATSSA